MRAMSLKARLIRAGFTVEYTSNGCRRGIKLYYGGIQVHNKDFACYDYGLSLVKKMEY